MTSWSECVRDDLHLASRQEKDVIILILMLFTCVEIGAFYVRGRTARDLQGLPILGELVEDWTWVFGT